MRASIFASDLAGYVTRGFPVVKTLQDMSLVGFVTRYSLVEALGGGVDDSGAIEIEEVMERAPLQVRNPPKEALDPRTLEP
jgi:CBS domain-containing protein